MSRIIRGTLRATVAASTLLVVGVGVIGAASASTNSRVAYTCTGSYPEVCIGLYSTNGSTVTSEQVQADLNDGTWYEVYVSQTDGNMSSNNFPTEMTKAGWTPTFPFPDDGDGEACAWVVYGSSQNGLSQTSPKACASYR
jgi:hypothetical protein